MRWASVGRRVVAVMCRWELARAVSCVQTVCRVASDELTQASVALRQAEGSRVDYMLLSVATDTADWRRIVTGGARTSVHLSHHSLVTVKATFACV
jgi:hypothetical protein